MANYVDNAKFYDEIVKYQAKYFAAQKAGEPLPIANNYLGKTIMEISNGLSIKKNFSGYSYREEMVNDGIDSCLGALHKFNTKHTNPFAYFTQCCFFAFLQRIAKEQKQAYIKYKATEHAIIMNSVADVAPEDHTHFQSYLSNINYDSVSSLIEKFEAKNKKKKVAKGVEVFLEIEEDEKVEDDEGSDPR